MTGDPEDAISFHRLTDEHGDFTNFSRHPIVVDGCLWATAEHYFQAQKFLEDQARSLVRAATTPSAAARIGKSRTWTLRVDWPTSRGTAMRRAVEAKFRQHPRLRERLLGTGSRRLLETTRSDYYWGTGADGSGANQNGRILTEVRDGLGIESRSRWAAEPTDGRAGYTVFFAAGPPVHVSRRHRNPGVVAWTDAGCPDDPILWVRLVS